MKLELVAKLGLCKVLICPVIYKSEKGTFIVQGTRVSDETRKNLSLAEGEEAVEIPAELVKALLTNLEE